MSLILAKLFWRYDLSLVDENLDLEGQGRMHVMWWKPSMYVRIVPRQTKQEA
jgi:hypothetical protein